MEAFEVILVLVIYAYVCIAARKSYGKLLEEILWDWDLNWIDPWMAMIIVGIIIGIISITLWPLLLIGLFVLLRYGWKEHKDELMLFFNELFEF